MVDGSVHGLSRSIKTVTDATFGRSAIIRSTFMALVPIVEYDQYQLPRRVLMSSQVEDATTDFSLWCCPDKAACVVHERHYGMTSIVQLNGRTDQDPESRQDMAIPGLLNACITPRESLVYAVRPPILSLRQGLRFEERLLKSERDLFTCISKESTTHEANVSKWENATIVAAAQSESTGLITLCTFKNHLVEIVKYTMDYERHIA